MNRNKFVIGLAIGTAAGAVGGYIAAKKRNWVKRELWKLKAKLEIKRRMRNLKRFTRNAYEEAVDTVMDKYREAGSVAEAEVTKLGDQLKGGWQEAKKRFDEAMEDSEEEVEDKEDDEEKVEDESETDEEKEK